MLCAWRNVRFVFRQVPALQLHDGPGFQPGRLRAALPLEIPLVEEKRPGQYFPVEEDKDGTYLLNARDLCMIEHIPELISAGVTSFKIEGRAKSAYYTAVVTNAYRCAIDGYLRAQDQTGYHPEPWILEELTRVSHREYCTGFYFDKPQANAQIFYDGGYRRDWEVAAVAGNTAGGLLHAVQRNRFFRGGNAERSGGWESAVCNYRAGALRCGGPPLGERSAPHDAGAAPL